MDKFLVGQKIFDRNKNVKKILVIAFVNRARTSLVLEVSETKWLQFSWKKCPQTILKINQKWLDYFE